MISSRFASLVGQGTENVERCEVHRRAGEQGAHHEFTSPAVRRTGDLPGLNSEVDFAVAPIPTHLALV